MEEIQKLRQTFLLNLRRKNQRESTSIIATSVINLLRRIIITEKAKTIPELLESLLSHGKYLTTMEPSELVIINIFLMASKLARDEVQAKKGQDVRAYDSLYTLWVANGPSDEKMPDTKKIRTDLIANIKELATEIESCRESIATQSTELIFNQDVVMVHCLSSSKTMDSFLAHARKTVRKFRILSVVESSQVEQSPDFASPILLNDVGSKMCETTKVVLSSVAIFPDGSCLVPAGGQSIALAAKKHSVPVYIIAPFYKMTPFFIPDPCAINSFQKIKMPFNFSAKSAEFVEIIQPAFDMIPSHLITLFVSNSSCIIPAHINRLKEDYYHPEDISMY